jgi:acyl transferase domain-containing protein
VQEADHSIAMEPFAIVGMAFRMPQEATNEDAFWDVLAHGRNLMTEWPESRVAVDAFHNVSGKANTVRLAPCYHVP